MTVGPSVQVAMELAFQALTQQEWSDAEALARFCVERDALNADAHHLLGAAASGAGSPHEAAKALERACNLKKDSSWLCDFASVLLICQRWDEAAAAFRSSLELAPQEARAIAGLGHVLCQLFRYEEALPLLYEAVRSSPSDLFALTSLARAHNGLEQYGSAHTLLQVALKLDPECRTTHCLLAEAYRGLRDSGKALEHAERAAAEAGTDARTLMILAACRLDCGLVEGALTARDRAWCRGFTDPTLHALALFLCLHDPGEDGSSLLRKHRQWARHHTGPAHVPGFRNEPDPSRPLRFGMVTAALRTTPGRFFRIPLLRALSKAGILVFLYNTHRDNSAADEEWFNFPISRREVWLLSVDEFAEQIRADRIDILIDGIGHHWHSRVTTFSKRVAPVQLNYSSYPGTTGTDAYDGFFSDRVCTPRGCEAEYTEPLLYLAGGRFLYAPPLRSPEVTSLPAVRTGYVTFGIFQRLSKLNRECLEAIAAITACSSSARLLFHSMDTAFDDRESLACLRLLAFFKARGIHSDRISFVAAQPLYEHLAVLGRADVALDTFPYNGQTTTCETLWMGVPLLTLRGRTHAGRIGAAILEAVNLPEWIASSVEEYVRLGSAVADNPARLIELRALLRDRLKRSPLLNAAAHASEIESACRQLWQSWCARQVR